MAQITAAAATTAVVVIFLVVPLFLFRVDDWRCCQAVAVVWQKSICNRVGRRWMMVVMMVIGIISALQSVLMKEILGRWVKATRVNGLRHVKVLGRCGSIWNRRRRVHGIQIGIGGSDCRWISDVVHDGRRRTRQLSRRNRIRLLNVRGVADFPFGTTRREKISQLSLIAAIRSLSGSRNACVVVYTGWGSPIRSDQQLISFGEVTRRETRV